MSPRKSPARKRRDFAAILMGLALVIAASFLTGPVVSSQTGGRVPELRASNVAIADCDANDAAIAPHCPMISACSALFPAGTDTSITPPPTGFAVAIAWRKLDSWSPSPRTEPPRSAFLF